ncbi:serine protease 41-like isoform X1 [Drosophila gunungcola]|nr:serine protease 41-like isoform X1 [Drosophila gunungcola]
MAAIQNETHFLCGGTLIHNRFVLTAARCIHGHTNLFVRLGAYNKSEPTFQVKVTAAIIHRSSSIFDFHYNVGLLKLSSRVKYNFYVRPICIILDTKHKSFIPTTLKAFGWGQNSDNLESDILQTITLDHYNERVCNRRLNFTMSSEQICAGAYNGDTCGSDSGGPLSTTLTVNGLPREAQIGIVSFGLRTCNGPGVYTKVASYVDWIQKRISNFDDSNKPQLAMPQQSPPAMVQDMWLHRDCGGGTMASILRADIFGHNFRAHGVLITDRFVITTARHLSENHDALKVIPIGMGWTYGDHRVDSVFKHTSDIALLKLSRPMRPTDGMKPICMLSNDQLQRMGEPPLPLSVFDPVSGGHFYLYTRECPWTINADEICVGTPPGISTTFGKAGDILGKQIIVSKKGRFVLFGIVSYSSDGYHILTNVMKHTGWIANTVKQNQF